jgi:hypothetical protein
MEARRSSLGSRVEAGMAQAAKGEAGGGVAAQASPKDPDVLLEGWLKKRGTRITHLWSERYFVLKGEQLLYYLKQGDPVRPAKGTQDPHKLFWGGLVTHNPISSRRCVAAMLPDTCRLAREQEARGAYIFDRTCHLSEIKSHTSAYDKKKMYVFRVLWPEAIEVTDLHTSEAESSGAVTKSESGGAPQPPPERAEAPRGAYRRCVHPLPHDTLLGYAYLDILPSIRLLLGPRAGCTLLETYNMTLRPGRLRANA